MPSCWDLTGQLQKHSLLRCDSGSNEKVTGEGLLVIVEMSKELVYTVMAVKVVAVVLDTVVVAAVVVAVVVVTAVVVAAVLVAALVAAAVAESKLKPVLVVVRDASKSMVSLSAGAMSFIVVNVMSVVVHRFRLRCRYWAQQSVCRVR